MLKMTGVKLERIVDIDMYLFIENGLRGGISYIAKRYSKLNNKYMKSYDLTKTVNIPIIYGWAISSYLPYGRFKWLKNADNFDVNSISEKSAIGYPIWSIPINYIYYTIIIH